MKKTCIFALAAILTIPALAANEDSIEAQASDVVVSDGADSVAPVKFENKSVTSFRQSNPDIRFPHGVQLGVGASVTGGLDGFIGYNNKKFDSFWWKRLGFRFGYASYSPIKKKMNSRINKYIDDDGVEIDDNLKLTEINMNGKHMGAYVDFYPFGDTWFLGGWRISGGYMTGMLDLTGDIQGTKNVGRIEFELGDRKYAYDGDTMHGKAKLNWKYKGPYLGTGFDLGLLWGFKIYMDAGVVFTDNNAKIDLNVPLDGLTDITNNPSVPEAIVGTVKDQFDIAKAKALSDAQKELDKVDYYPIVKLGFMYRF